MQLRAISTITLAAAILFSGMAISQEKKKNWADRAEYDIYDQIVKEAQPAKRLELLKTWKEKYPSSDYKQERQTVFVNTYVQLNKGQDTWEAAKELLTIDPKDFTGLYWLTRLSMTLGTGPDILDTGEKAANSLLGILDTFFAEDKRQPNVTPDQWKKARADVEVEAWRALGWIAMTKKDVPGAEKAFAKVLQMNPNDAQVSYWLYSVIRSTKDVKRYPEALYHLARAASVTGPGALPDANRKQVDEFFVKAYNSFHGVDEAGLAVLRKAALASAMPPAGFTIVDYVTILEEKQKEMMKSDPQGYLWSNVKRELIGPNGESYYENTLKGAGLPGKQTVEGVDFDKFRGYLVALKPAVNPKEIILAMDKGGTQGDVTLKLEAPIRGRADPGTEIQFSGTASAFTKEPFMLTFDIDKDNLRGWPVAQGPATTTPKKTGGAVVKKGGATTKKKK